MSQAVRSDPYVVCFLPPGADPVFQTQAIWAGSWELSRLESGNTDETSRLQAWVKVTCHMTLHEKAFAGDQKSRQVCRQTLDPVWDEALPIFWMQ